MEMNPNKLKSDLRKFRIATIILTLLNVLFFLLIIGGFAFIVKNKILDAGIISLGIFLIILSSIILGVVQMIFVFIIMKYERKHLSISRAKTLDNFQMIMFTGIIGLWLWLPNKNEIDEMINRNNLNKNSEN